MTTLHQPWTVTTSVSPASSRPWPSASRAPSKTIRGATPSSRSPKKVFVFLGGDGPEDRLSLSGEVAESAVAGLTHAVHDTHRLRLGRSGWVTARFEWGDAVPTDILGDWIDESYRAVAPKKLVAELDQRAGSAEARLLFTTRTERSRAT